MRSFEFARHIFMNIIRWQSNASTNANNWQLTRFNEALYGSLGHAAQLPRGFINRPEDHGRRTYSSPLVLAARYEGCSYKVRAY